MQLNSSVAAFPASLTPSSPPVWSDSEMGRLKWGSVEKEREELVWEGQQLLGHWLELCSAFTLQQVLHCDRER